MRVIFTMAFLWIALLSTAQQDFNLTFVSNLDYPERCNDIWGYVAPDGTEYAILGTVEATAVISLADPENPQEVAYIDGETSTWRDMKSWGEYVYVTTDVGEDGLLVINMSGAPNNITWEFWQPILTVDGQSDQLGACHNIYIDENGFAYLSGCSNINSGGVLIIDVHSNPGQPAYVGAAAGIYSHDNFVRGDTLWSSDIFAGYFSVQDVSDKTDVFTQSVQTTSSDFTHNAWLSDDGNFLFTTDERPNAFVDAYDVSDLSDIQFLDSYQPSATAGEGVIPHNTHYKDGFLVTSWYTDGIVIVDAHRPENLIKVGAYDTFIGPHGGFNGSWGAYPWLPSGLILASDVQRGLIVLEPDYVRACYLEGQVTDADTGDPINNVTVQLLADEAPEQSTDFMGTYKTGHATAGTYSVVFNALGYIPQTVEATLVNGEITILNVQLQSQVPFQLNVNLINEADNSPIVLGNVVIFDEFNSTSLITNFQGTSSITNFF
ncbi:MAG: choice-of-anchor B family protein, partial [Bacteroidota bacterium]